MTLLYEKVGSDNARRCDAKCYDARNEKCDCICGGVNHGVGEEAAINNVREQFGDVTDLLIEYGGIAV